MMRVTFIALAFCAGTAYSQGPEMPPPPKEAEWLQKFVGEWETDMEAVMAPGQPAIKCKGSAAARSLGGYWVPQAVQMKASIAKPSGHFAGVLPPTA